MNRLWMLLLVLALLGLSARSARADFGYANFATANSTSGGQTLHVNGSASVGYLGSQLQLTPSSPSQGGSAFTTNAISLGNNGSFSTHFQFQLSNSGGIGDGDGSGADGIVFVVQTVSNNVGANGGGIGYFGIPNSIGIEFDTFNNGEISGNHVGVDENGGLQDFGAVNEPTRFNNGQIWNAWIDYDRYASNLEVRWSLLPTRPASSMLTLGGVNLPAILGTNNAFVGFTAATGAAYNDQDILNWQFNQINQSPWTGDADTGWATPNNWSGPVPGATAGTTNGDMAIFNRSAPHSPLTIDAGRNLENITFDTSSVNSLTIGTTGGNSLRLTAGGTIQTTSAVVNSQVINCPLILEGDYAFTSGASSSSATLRLGGRITPGATSGVTTLTINGANAGNNTIGGILADNGAGKLALTKSGAGIWIISSVNTFTGPTTVSAGTLVLANSAAAQDSTINIGSDNGLAFAPGLGSATVGGLAGTGNLALQDKATTPAAVNLTAGGDGDSTTFSGVISGAGSILKTGTGTLALSAANTYTGGTTISTGAIVLVNSNAAQNSTITVNTDNGLAFTAALGSATFGGLSGSGKFALQDQAASPAAVNITVGGNSGSTSYSGVMSGTGGVTKVGTGTLSLLGINTYTGVTTINAGVMQLGDGATTNGLVAGNISDNATLAFANPNAQSYSGVISGSGGVTKVGAGTLSLLGINTYTGVTTISAGVVQLGDGATTNGSVVGNVSDNATLVFADPIAQTYAGIISGNGGVTKTGAGILALTGANTYSGGTAVNGGPLQIAGPTTISSGNIVSSPIGKGTLTLAAGTTLQDDGAARTLANNLVINGNVTFASAGEGNLTISTTSLTTATNVVLHNNPTFNVTNTTTIKSVIDGPGQSLTMSGAGTLIFGGANDYTGGTTIDAGTLTVNAGGSLGGGPLTIIAASGTHPMLSVFASQAVISVTANESGTGSATINVASPGTTLTTYGSLTASGSLNVNGGGTLEIQSAPTIAANSHIFVNNDTMRFSATTGAAVIGAGVVTSVNVGSTLELAGSVSALSSAVNRVNITTVAASKGVLVSGTNQRVGQINGAGSVVVNAGSDLTANHIIQGALVIGGTNGSPGFVTIDASDASGNPLDQSSGFALAGSLTPNAPFGTDGISSADLSRASGADFAVMSPEDSVGVGNLSPVPEPSTLLLMLLAVLCVVGAQFVRHHFRCQTA
jgi:fibronectin-binding autotransporter adhesin